MAETWVFIWTDKDPSPSKLDQHLGPDRYSIIRLLLGSNINPNLGPDIQDPRSPFISGSTVNSAHMQSTYWPPLIGAVSAQPKS